MSLNLSSRIAIAGGSISGLATARMLCKLGFNSVHVLSEDRSKLGKNQRCIVLPPNAVKALQPLTEMDDIYKIGYPVDTIGTKSTDGSVTHDFSSSTRGVVVEESKLYDILSHGLDIHMNPLESYLIDENKKNGPVFIQLKDNEKFHSDFVIFDNKLGWKYANGSTSSNASRVYLSGITHSVEESWISSFNGTNTNSLGVNSLFEMIDIHGVRFSFSPLRSDKPCKGVWFISFPSSSLTSSMKPIDYLKLLTNNWPQHNLFMDIIHNTIIESVTMETIVDLDAQKKIEWSKERVLNLAAPVSFDLYQNPSLGIESGVLAALSMKNAINNHSGFSNALKLYKNHTDLRVHNVLRFQLSEHEEESSFMNKIGNMALSIFPKDPHMTNTLFNYNVHKIMK